MPFVSVRVRMSLVAAAWMLAAANASAVDRPAVRRGAGDAAAQATGQAAGAMLRVCRTDLRRFCADIQPGGGRIAGCLRDNADALSPACTAAISKMRQNRADGANTSESQQPAHLPPGASVIRDLAYGKAPQQRLDVYRPANPQNAPIIVMVHGGAWAFGSKDAPGVVENKVAHFLPGGYLFISVETRLLPDTTPLQQADDVAAALASVQQNAASWGGDASKLVLIGHSAGAHLVALVSADRSITEKAGLTPWLATIALDSAAYDVTTIMNEPSHPKLYDRAFGKDPAFWTKVSPTLQLTDGGLASMPPMLLVCSSLRKDSCRQAQAFASKAGGKAKVLPVALRHEVINAELGAGNDYTRQVDAFLRTVGLN